MTFHPNPDHHDIMHCFIPFDQTTRVLRDSREDMMVGDLLNPRMTAPLIVCETGEGRVPFKLNRELIYLAGEYGYSDIIKTNAKFCDGQALTFDHRQFLKDMYPLCENATDGSEVCRTPAGTLQGGNSEEMLMYDSIVNRNELPAGSWGTTRGNSQLVEPTPLPEYFCIPVTSPSH